MEVEDVITDPLAVNGVTSSMADLMKQCIDRLEKLEMKVSQPRPRADDGRVNQLQTGRAGERPRRCVSLLHSDVWHRISVSHAALQPWSGPRLVGVDGSELRVCGNVKLALKIGTASVSTPVVVVDTLTAEGILGMDFLRHHQCNINIPDNSLTLSQLGITVPLQTPTT